MSHSTIIIYVYKVNVFEYKSRFFYANETILEIFIHDEKASSTFQRMRECESIKVWKLGHQQQKHLRENSTPVTVQLIPMVISLGTQTYSSFSSFQANSIQVFQVAHLFKKYCMRESEAQKKPKGPPNLMGYLVCRKPKHFQNALHSNTKKINDRKREFYCIWQY